MTTIRLTAEPLSVFEPFPGCDAEVRVYAGVLVYEFDAEHSEMWAMDHCRAELVEDVRRTVARPYAPLPVVLVLCDGRAVGVLGSGPLRIERPDGSELIDVTEVRYEQA